MEKKITKKLSKKEQKKQDLLKEAKYIFSDSFYYSNHQLISYLRLLKQVVAENELTKNYISISSIENYLEFRKNDTAKIIYLYFFENYTLVDIELMLNSSTMTIYRQKLKELELFRESLMLLKIAKNIFIDASSYTDNDLIGYCKLFRKISNNFTLQTNLVSIKILERLLAINKYNNYILLHFFQDYTFSRIGKKFNIDVKKVKRIVEVEINTLREELHLYNEAKRIFTDTSRYSLEKLIGYCKLLTEVSKNSTLPDNFISIYKIEKILQKRNKVHYKVVYLYFVKKLNLIEIGKEFSLTSEGVRRIKLKQISLLQKELNL